MREYRLIRSQRKTVSLEITREAEVLVRAPNRMKRAEIDRFVEKHEDWIRVHLEKVEQKKKVRQSLTEEDIVRLKQDAVRILPEKVAYYSRIMNLKPTGLKITSAQKRFGSCSGKNSLCFSWMLMQYPEVAIDYVVVHELAHIKHHNHSREFYALIERYLPDYRERERLLRSAPNGNFEENGIGNL